MASAVDDSTINIVVVIIIIIIIIFPGVVGLVAHVADGSTKSETTPARHLPTSGDRPLDAVIMGERRDGPHRLCDDDDDDDVRD